MAKALGWEVKGIQLMDVGPDHSVATITDPKSTIHQITYHRLKGKLWQVRFWDTRSKKQIFLQRGVHGQPLRSANDCLPVIIVLKEDGYNPKTWGKDKSYQFDQAIETWITLSTCSREWLEQRRQIAKRLFVPYFRKRDIRDIKTMDINRWVSEMKKLGLSPKTVCNVVGELRAFFRFHKRTLTSLPDFPQVKFQVPKVRHISKDDQDHIFGFIPQEHLPIFAMLRFYGCRENEASGLLRENVFLDVPKPYVVIATALGKWGQVKPNTKTMKARVLPIPEKLRWIFENNSDGRFVFTRNGRPYRYRMLNTSWNKANEMANKKYGTPIINLRNATRHSFACQKLDEGFPIFKVKTVLGHSNIKTTERYGEYSTEALEDIVEGEIVHTKLIPNKLTQLIETHKEDMFHSKVPDLSSLPER